MNEPGSLRRGATAAALVSQMTVLTVLCGWGGRQLDGRLLTAPQLQTAGFVLGFTLGLANFLRHVSQLAPPDPPDHDDQPPPDPPV